jgi:hypothetical protein
MGANATTFVPSYTSGEVLTAANLSVTNSGIPVFATTTTRDAAFGGTGEKTLAEGQFAYIEATNTTQYYDGAAWQSVGVTPGLVLVKTQTIGSAVSSVEVTGAFSSTYDNYLITLEGGVASTNVGLRLTLGATATGYLFAGTFVQYNSSTVGGQFGGGTNWEIGYGSTNALSAEIVLGSPNLAKVTTFRSRGADTGTTGYMNSYSGFLNNSTQYTAFTIATSTGNMTGGVIRVYGYQNS